MVDVIKVSISQNTINLWNLMSQNLLIDGVVLENMFNEFVPTTTSLREWIAFLTNHDFTTFTVWSFRDTYYVTSHGARIFWRQSNVHHDK